MQNNNYGIPTYFFLIKRNGLKLPLCLMKASHHEDMGHFRYSFMLLLFYLDINVALCIELSVWICQRRKASVCPGQEWNQFPSDLLGLIENCMEQQVFSG
jgi:hypothetical protein